jgi:hypothetical protein
MQHNNHRAAHVVEFPNVDSNLGLQIFRGFRCLTVSGIVPLKLQHKLDLAFSQ